MESNLTPEAESDWHRVMLWYEQEHAGWDVDFSQQVKAALRRIESQPRMYAAGFRGIRKCPVDRYPYVIIYRIDGDLLDVFAIIHVKRRASAWTSRLNPQ